VTAWQRAGRRARERSDASRGRDASHQRLKCSRRFSEAPQRLQQFGLDLQNYAGPCPDGHQGNEGPGSWARVMATGAGSCVNRSADPQLFPVLFGVGGFIWWGGVTGIAGVGGATPRPGHANGPGRSSWKPPGPGGLLDVLEISLGRLTWSKGCPL